MKNVSHFFAITVSLLMMSAAPAASFAQTTSASSTPATNISKDYSYFLGKVDSQQVVNDLRNGQWTTKVTDPNTKVTTTTTEALPTGKMGYGNVKISLALAQESLRQQGITQPTSEQLHMAMVGDSTTSGILQMRADGMGWGQIAQKYDVKLGQLMSGRQPASTSTATSTTTSTSTTNKGITTANGKSATTAAGKGNGKAFSGSDSQGSGIVTASGRTAGTASGSGSQSGGGIVSGSGRSTGQNTSGIVTGGGRGGNQYGASGGGNGNAGGQGRGPKYPVKQMIEENLTVPPN